jgi:hypothetical protein
MDAESGAGVVRLAEPTDLESCNHSCASRLPGKRPMTVLMTGEAVSADALLDKTATTTGGGKILPEMLTRIDDTCTARTNRRYSTNEHGKH